MPRSSLLTMPNSSRKSVRLRHVTFPTTTGSIKRPSSAIVFSTSDLTFILSKKMKNIALNSLRRAASTLTKEAGDISSVFPSLSGKAPEPLPPRFSDLKKRLVAGNEDALKASWHRLLKELRLEIDEIKEKGNSVRCYSFTASFYTKPSSR